MKDNDKHDLAVIFSYHKVDDVTLRNLQVFKDNNPDIPVILVSNGGETMPCSLNTKNLLKGAWAKYRYHARFMKVRHIRYLWHLLKNGTPKEYYWSNADLPIYIAYDASREQVQADRYIHLEWDCYCNVDLREFYKEVWNADLGARHVIDPASDPDWVFFGEKYSQTYPSKAAANVCGAAPFAGVLLSDRALSLICEELKNDVGWRTTFCELRLGTLAKLLNLDIQELPEYKKKFLRGELPCWELSEINEPAVWHMVKN